MKLNIITPEDTLYEDEVKSVQLQGTDGKFQILNNHAPIVSALDKGLIKIVDKDDKSRLREVLSRCRTTTFRFWLSSLGI